MRYPKQHNQGFTMVELVIALVIIGILSAIVLPKYVDFTGQAAQQSAKANAESLQLAHSTAMGLLADSNPSNPYPTLENLVGASGQVRPAVPSGWSNNSTPPASPPPYIYSENYANAFGAGSQFYENNPSNTDPAAFADALCKILFGNNPEITGSLANYKRDAYCQFNGYRSSGGDIPYNCPSGYTLSKWLGYAYYFQDPSCVLTDASAISCPTGYTRNGSSCNLTNPADAGTPGRLPLALNNSGVCVGPTLKAATWTDQARTTATSAAGSAVRQIDATPVADETNCPASLFL